MKPSVLESTLIKNNRKKTGRNSHKYCQSDGSFKAIMQSELWDFFRDIWKFLQDKNYFCLFISVFFF